MYALRPLFRPYIPVVIADRRRAIPAGYLTAPIPSRSAPVTEQMAYNRTHRENEAIDRMEDGWERYTADVAIAYAAIKTRMGNREVSSALNVELAQTLFDDLSYGLDSYDRKNGPGGKAIKDICAAHFPDTFLTAEEVRDFLATFSPGLRAKYDLPMRPSSDDATRIALQKFEEITRIPVPV